MEPIVQYGRSLGIVFEDRPLENFDYDKLRWNGTSLSIHLGRKEMLHEICHWILAGPNDRNKANFGLVRAYRREHAVLFLEEILSIRFGMHNPAVYRLDHETLNNLSVISKIFKDLKSQHYNVPFMIDGTNEGYVIKRV